MNANGLARQLRRTDWLLSLTVVILATLAFLTLQSWDRGAFAAFLDAQQGFVFWPRDLAFAADWTAMCAAMMLPTALPLLSAVRRVARTRQEPFLLWLTALAFIGVWLAVGLVIREFAVQLADKKIVVDFVRDYQRDLLGWAFISAGLYTISPIASRCAKACRSPISFIATRWTGKAPRYDAIRIGSAYSLSCFGCCWPQMVLLSIVGMSNPFWMLMATLTMVGQKSKRLGRTTELALAVGLWVIGAVCLAGWIGLPVDTMLWRTIGDICSVR